MTGNLYVISGVTGMTGNELARQITKSGNMVIGFDNFFRSDLIKIISMVKNKNV